MIPGFVSITRFKDEAEFKQMCLDAQKEGHGVFLPTHPLRKDGKVVGYFSVSPANMATVFAWLGEVIPARESFHLVNAVEDAVARNGTPIICFPIPKSSTFYPLMESLGYRPCGEYTWFVKDLTKDI